MKLAIDASKIESPIRTGTETYAWEMITGLLSRLSPEVEVVLYVRVGVSDEILRMRPNVSVRVVSGRWFWTLWHLSWALRKDRPDMFYTPASIIPPFHPKRSVVVIHGLEYEYFPQSYSVFRFWHLATFTLLSARWAWKVIVPSQSTKKDLVSQYQILKEKISVILSGIPSVDESGEIRDEVRKLKDRKYIFWIGRKEMRKNVDFLVRVFARLREERKDLILVLAGNAGYGYNAIDLEIRRLNVRDSVIELSSVSQAEKEFLYKYALVFAFPSWYEGFGFPILESMRAGVPVIASNTSSLPEIGGAACVYADPEDESEWERELGRLVDSEETRNRLRERGIARIRDFSFEKSVEETRILLEDTDLSK